MVKYEDTFMFKSTLHTLSSALQDNYYNAMRNSEILQLLADIIVDFTEKGNIFNVLEGDAFYRVADEYADAIRDLSSKETEYVAVTNDNGNMIDLSFEVNGNERNPLYQIKVGRKVVTNPQVLIQIGQHVSNSGKKVYACYCNLDHYMVLKGETLVTPDWIDNLKQNPQKYFGTVLDRVIQNEQIQAMYYKAVQLFLDGNFKVSAFREWVHDHYHGLRGEALTVYTATMDAMDQGIPAVVNLIKDYSEYLKNVKLNKEETAFEFPVHTVFTTKAWDWGVVISAAGKIAELVGILLAKFVNPIVGAVTTLLGFIGDAIGRWVTDSFVNEVVFSVQNLSESIGFVNPMLQWKYLMHSNIRPYTPLALKIEQSMRANGAYMIHIPGIECIVFPTFNATDPTSPSVDWANIELRLSCDFLINKDYWVNVVRTSAAGIPYFQFSTYEDLVKNGSCGNSIALDSASNDDIAAMIASAYICYALMLNGPSSTDFIIGNPTPETPEWIRCAIDCCEYLDKYYTGIGVDSYDGFMSSFTSRMAKICALEQAPLDADMNTGNDASNINTKRFEWPLQYLEKVLESTSYEEGGHLYFNSALAEIKPDGFLANIIREFPAPAVYPPKYTRAAKIFGYALSVTIVAAVTFASVYAGLKIKKFTSRKAASNAAACEAAWSELTKHRTKENFDAYYEAIRRNNRWATFGIGTKISASSYWSAPNPTAVDPSELNQQLDENAKKLSSNSAGEGSESVTYTIEDVYLAICSTPLSKSQN